MEKLEQLAREMKGHGPGAEQAFQELYESTKRTALSVIRRYCDIDGDYEDLLQETYIRVYRSIDSLRDETKVLAWIGKIAANTATRHNMKKWPKMFSELMDDEGQLPDFEDETGAFEPEVIADKKAVAQAVNQVLDTLPPDQRAALWMVYGQQITIKEMAESLGISENTIKSRLYQGRNKLMARKDEFRRLGVELTVIPVSLLISMAFRQDVYAAVAEGAAAAAGSMAAGAAVKAAPEKMAAEAAAKHAPEKMAAAAAGTAAKAGMALGTKVLLGAAAVVIIGGGAAAGHMLLSDIAPAASATEQQPQEAPAWPAETSAAMPESGETTQEPSVEEPSTPAGTYSLTSGETAVLTEAFAAISSGDKETLCITVRDNLEILFNLDYEKFQGQNMLFDGDSLAPLNDGTGMVIQYTVGSNRNEMYSKALRVYYGTFRDGKPDGTLTAVNYINPPHLENAYMDYTVADYKAGVLDRSHFETSFIDVRDRDGNPIYEVEADSFGEFPDDSRILNGNYTVHAFGDTYELFFENYDMQDYSQDELMIPVGGGEGISKSDLAAFINSNIRWRDGRPGKENVDKAEF